MNRKTLLLIGGGAVALCCICVAIVGAIAAMGGLAALGLTQPAVDAGDSFMSALRDGKYNDAYNLCTRDLQKELGSPRDLQSIIEDNDAKPTKWSFTSRNIENDVAELTGDVTLTGNRNGDVTLVLMKEDDKWKVAGFDIQER